MTEFNPSLPIAQKSDATEEPKVTTAFEELKTIINGKVDKTNTAAEIPLIAAATKYVALKNFTAAEANAGVEISATRPAFALLRVEAGAAENKPLSVGGVEVYANLKEEAVLVLVPAGQKWKVNAKITATWIIC